MLQNHKVSLSGASACTYPHLLIHGYLSPVFISSSFSSVSQNLTDVSENRENPYPRFSVCA